MMMLWTPKRNPKPKIYLKTRITVLNTSVGLKYSYGYCKNIVPVSNLRGVMGTILNSIVRTICTPKEIYGPEANHGTSLIFPRVGKAENRKSGPSFCDYTIKQENLRHGHNLHSICHRSKMSAVLDAIKDADPMVGGLALFGSLIAFSYASKAIIAAYKVFLRPGKNLRKLGEWAVVTGATDGIGKEYAIAFAKQGMSVVLISRTESKLQDVAKTIKEKYPNVETKYVVCDYSKFDDKARTKVNDAIKDLEVGVLVNNVGISYKYPLFFHELSNEEVAALMEMNINSATYMTKMVIGGMVERKRGAIVNLSSGSAMYTMPLLAEYSGAKSFLEKFSRALNAEYKSKGVTCQCQIPFYVATKLAKMRKSMMVPTPKEYVALAMKWVGQSDAVASPFFPHAFQGWVLDQLPDFIVSAGIMSMHAGIRKRGIKKDAKKAAEAENAKKGN